MHLAFAVTHATHVRQLKSRVHPSHFPQATRRAFFPAVGVFLPAAEGVAYFLFNPTSMSNSDSLKVVALRALPELDGRYAVLGQVTKGMEVVDQLVQGDKLIKAVVVEGGTLVKDNP